MWSCVFLFVWFCCFIPLSDAWCTLLLFSPLHLCISTLNVAIVKRWAEIASCKEISEAIDIPSSAGTALCMAASLKKDRERGKIDRQKLSVVKQILNFSCDWTFYWISFFSFYSSAIKIIYILLLSLLSVNTLSLVHCFWLVGICLNGRSAYMFANLIYNGSCCPPFF